MRFPIQKSPIEMIIDRGKEIFIEDKKGKDTKKVKIKGKYKLVKGKRKFVPFENNDKIFDFKKRQASKVFDSAVKKTGVRVIPTGDKPTWKDLRSGMACHLFGKGWVSDDINLRLGHKISSRELDVYVSYLAANKKMPKKKLFHSNLEEVQDELEEAKRREKLQGQRMDRQGKDLDETQSELRALQDKVRLLLKQQGIKV